MTTLVANIDGNGNALRVWSASADNRFTVELIADGKAITLGVGPDELVGFTRALAQFCLPLEQIERGSILSRVYVSPGDMPKVGPVAWPLAFGVHILTVRATPEGP